MRRDMAIKRGKMIGKVNSLMQEFHAADISIIMKCVNNYATGIYGSCTWDIMSRECDRLYTAWNVAVRQILKINRCTHRFLIEDLSECLHLKTKLASRYVSFFESIMNSSKFSVRFLGNLCATDQRTVFERTLTSIATECNLFLLETKR